MRSSVVPPHQNSFTRYVPPGEKRSMQNGVGINGSMFKQDSRSADASSRTNAVAMGSNAKLPTGRGSSVGELRFGINGFKPIASASSPSISNGIRANQGAAPPGNFVAPPGTEVTSKTRESVIRMKKLEVCDFFLPRIFIKNKMT